MIKTISRIINKILWPQRVKAGKRCNDGIWWWIPALVQAVGSAAGAIGSAAGAVGSAIGSAAGAIGSGIGSAAGAIGSGISSAIGGIGSALGIGGGSSAGGSLMATGKTALQAGTSGVLSGAAPGTIGGTIANTAATAAPTLSSGAGAIGAAESASALSNAAALGKLTTAAELGSKPLGGLTSAAEKAVAQEGFKALAEEGAKAQLWNSIKDIGGLASKEMLGFDPKASLKENAGNMLVKQIEGSMGKKGESPMNVSLDNSYSGQAPNIQPSSPASSTKSGKGTISPEMMMQIIAMMQKQKARGGTAPIADNFPGGFY